MEPLAKERNHGSQESSRLTCKNARSRERRLGAQALLITVQLSRCGIRSLTWVRALPGVWLTTGALAPSDNDRA